MAQEGDGNVSLEPTRLRLMSRHQSFGLSVTATSASNNVFFECGDLWNSDNTGFLVFGVVNRNDSANTQLSYVNFTGAKISGEGTQGNYNIINQFSANGGTFAVSSYTEGGGGASHATKVALNGGQTNGVVYRLDLYVVNISRISVD
jgi:hypothetical protein